MQYHIAVLILIIAWVLLTWVRLDLLRIERNSNIAHGACSRVILKARTYTVCSIS